MRSKAVFLNCSYIPSELLAAAGFSPSRSWPGEIGQKGQDLIPNDFCPYSRAYLAWLMDKDGISVFANSCDAMRRVYDARADSAFFLEIPRTTGEMAVDYFHHQLEKLLTYLGINPQKNGFTEKLKEKIRQFNHGRNLLNQLRENLIKNGDHSFSLLLKGVKLYYEQQAEKIEGLVRKTAPVNGYRQDTRPRVLLSSSCLLDETLIQLVEKTGLKIVGVDSCLGERSFNFSVDLADEPLKSLARSYLTKPSCPRTMEPERRIAQVSCLMDSRQADGLIYFLPKFCDQAAYEFYFLKKWAQKSGKPILQVEGEYGAGKTGQLNTRVTAFREALEMKNA